MMTCLAAPRLGGEDLWVAATGGSDAAVVGLAWQMAGDNAEHRSGDTMMGVFASLAVASSLKVISRQASPAHTATGREAWAS